MATFHHIGVPVSAKQEGAAYIEGGKVWATDPADHPYNVEYLFFESDTPMHELIQTKNHVAFMVEDLDAALVGKTVICDPFDATETLRVAFIEDRGAILELMQAL